MFLAIFFTKLKTPVYGLKEMGVFLESLPKL
jgi:hypothetical protein